jgi:hypothetical protein
MNTPFSLIDFVYLFDIFGVIGSRLTANSIALVCDGGSVTVFEAPNGEFQLNDLPPASHQTIILAIASVLGLDLGAVMQDYQLLFTEEQPPIFSSYYGDLWKRKHAECAI